MKFGGGGALSIRDARNVSLSRTIFTSNQHELDGGAVYIENVERSYDVSIKECTFNKNSVQGFGGAIAFKRSFKISMTDCKFDQNSADRGGAFYSYDGTVLIQEDRNEYTKNSAKTQGPDRATAFSGITPSFKDDVLFWPSGQVISNFSVSVKDAYGQVSPKESMPVVMAFEFYVINTTVPTNKAFKVVGTTQSYFTQTVVPFPTFTFFAVPGAYNFSVWRINYDNTKHSLLASKTVMVQQCDTSNPKYIYVNATDGPGACHESLFFFTHF
jgi:predicted outer membrane repeat protein